MGGQVGQKSRAGPSASIASGHTFRASWLASVSTILGNSSVTLPTSIPVSKIALFVLAGYGRQRRTKSASVGGCWHVLPVRPAPITPCRW